MPTPDLFDFDPHELTDYEPVKVRRALTNHPAIYINHLEIARWLDGWADTLEEYQSVGREDRDFIDAVRQVSGHLRQGDFVPDGLFLREARETAEQALREKWQQG